MEQQLLSTPTATEWNKIGVRHHHGINIPLFSLHSQQSAGIGEFLDLLPLIEWCSSIGLDVIQLLPINDTGNDTSPYSALSAFALNPIHLGLSQLPFLDESPNLKAMLNSIQSQCLTQRIVYPNVQQTRYQFLQAYFQQFGTQIASTNEYKQFFQENRHWLLPYGLFKALKIEKQWSSWETWEPELQNPSPDTLQASYQNYENAIQFHAVIQFLCFTQMRAVKTHADRFGVSIKGDIPILINLESADVWVHRHLFQMGFSAGAPPDMLSSVGQDWGFPIYDWTVHEGDNYAWWKQRLITASKCFHIYRIDHIIGFFRIWSIPRGKLSNEGWYIPNDTSTWISQGTKIMEMMIVACPMLPIGEDLGNVPPEVREIMNRLGICGTKVMRWERMWNEDRRFVESKDYAPDSMTTVSTHDSETLQIWWNEHPDEARDFSAFKKWSYQPQLTLAQHQEILYDSHHTSSLFHINLLQEYLALVPGMTWDNPLDERINIPGLVLDSNWAYRFRPTVEEIVSNANLRQYIAAIIH
ncbi:MAG: 4-alpha-glucanotransferase [Parachlamydiaceae bacterium]|nr:4-alpha-glucanotransferase [Parachlamydiaceae bacterium]